MRDTHEHTTNEHYCMEGNCYITDRHRSIRTIRTGLRTPATSSPPSGRDEISKSVEKRDAATPQGKGNQDKAARAQLRARGETHGTDDESTDGEQAVTGADAASASLDPLTCSPSACSSCR
ncbi:hypothetical protein NUW54_g14203 [Trametes sanguinea]|uniref:Uncharacterized protein n=1 Tax=Trametes sanguinea TaxID=158606 RepID=A0ACC1MEN4_9APHY|nr:hypothetical protein NUW54_g14203 [Trametes sanguinea]